MRDPRRIRLLFALAVVTSITLLAASSGFIGYSARDFTSSWMSPLQSAGRAVAAPFHNIATSLTDLANLRRENDSLRQDNDKLRAEAVRAVDERRRLAELDSMLDLAGKGKYKIVAANIIGWPQMDDTGAALHIDAGKRDGIRVWMTVISGRGLVGSTVAVGAASSTVRLLSDPDSHVGIRVARTSAVGIATGSGRDEDLHLDMFSMLELRAGEAVVTRGSLNGVPFVAGVPVGRIVTVGGTAGELPIGTIAPYVDAHSLSSVGVVVAVPKSDPRDSLLPTPLPTPTVTVTVTASPSASLPSPSSGALSSSAPTPSSSRSPTPTGTRR